MPSDRVPFARVNSDVAVMQYFPAVLSKEESNQLVDRFITHFARHGFGPWAAETRDQSEFIGYIGLAVPRFEAAFTPCVEIGWRLAASHWGRGLAFEGAQAVVRHAFSILDLTELVSFTVPANRRSRSVMEKLRMTRDPADDFEHPQLPAGHPLRRHVLYRLTRDAWLARQLGVSSALY
jgi:ribosomal-protein-alanine N-acetyltransferase